MFSLFAELYWLGVSIFCVKLVIEAWIRVVSWRMLLFSELLMRFAGFSLASSAS